MPSTNPDARTELERRVHQGLVEITDLHEGDAIFGDRDRATAYFVDGTQIANFVGENNLGVRLTRKKISELRSQLKADPRVDLLRSGGDWIGVRFASKNDADDAVSLACLAAEVHRPAGRPPRLPPEGTDLERRQRFH